MLAVPKPNAVAAAAAVEAPVPPRATATVPLAKSDALVELVTLAVLATTAVSRLATFGIA